MTDLLEAAKQALIAAARDAHQHSVQIDFGDRDAAKQVAYGQALGAQAALAAFLAAIAGDDEIPDPTDQARAYAEGYELQETS